MIKFRIDGAKKVAPDLHRLTAAFSKKMDTTLFRQMNRVMEYAKTKRFRKVPSPMKRVKTVTGWGEKKKGGYYIRTRLVYPPIRGILTMRHQGSGYMSRIGPPKKVAPGKYEITARVPYADKHEKTRPVLTAALNHQKDDIEKAVGLSINETIKSEGWNR